MLFEHEILSNLSIQIAHKIVDYAAKMKALQASRSWMQTWKKAWTCGHCPRTFLTIVEISRLFWNKT